MTEPTTPHEPAVPALATPSMPAPAATAAARWRRARRRLTKVALFVVSLFLFVLAIILMKEGAGALTPIIQRLDLAGTVASSLGAAWLAAYAIMSGSPIAAMALAFFAAGAVDAPGTFAMITGSRLGATFFVIFIGFVYILRGRDRATSLSMGLLSWLVTLTTYVFSFPLGLVILQRGWLDGMRPRSTVALSSMLNAIFDPIARLATGMLPDWLIFVVGVAIILTSFSLFDRALPRMSLKESQVGRVSLFVYRPLVMFLLGAAITTLSMSVSISLSILVPLSARGFVRRENVIPYIMGANITTFIDTLLASILLSNPRAFTIVWVHMLTITLVSLVILLAGYRHYERLILRLVTLTTDSNRNLAVFMFVVFAVPFLLLLS